MIVIINSECTGSARHRSQAILDVFLPRVGRRTWAGAITVDGLDRLKKTLLKQVTVNNSICCRKVETRRRLSVEWIIGNKKKFDIDGNCSVSITSKLIQMEQNLSASEKLLYEASTLAALFHDLGKNTDWFQLKLLAAAPISDPIRHELISFAVLKAMLILSGNDEEAWLKNLANREGLFGFIDRAYALAFEQSKSTDQNHLDQVGFRKLIFKFSGSDIISSLQKQSNSSIIDFYPDEKAPKFSLVSLLILTHHRLPNGDIKNKYDDKHHALILQGDNMTNSHYHSGAKIPTKKLSPSQLASNKVHIRQALEHLSMLPEGKIKMYSDERFLDEVASVAKKLAETKSTDFDLDVRVAATYGRTALILGDHKASKIGNTRFPKDGKPADKNLVYANTNREKDNQLAEPLASHLCRVASKTNNALKGLLVECPQMPSLSLEETPRAIRYPEPAKGTPFEWQYKSAKATKKAFKSVSDDTDFGFFGVLMAGTGSGKTRMAPIIMSTLSKDRLRMNVCTGMRTLTLQGGLEYQRDMGFKPEDVSVVIGDQLTSDLFNLDNLTVGTEADHLENMTVAQLSDEKNGYTQALPDNIRKVMPSDNNDDSDTVFMATPILVSTIDTLMSAADATRGSHVIKSLRVATSDLIIDEIDDYANEDLVAISRLIYLAGVYGRKVMLSSATISPEISSAMYNAYVAGRKVYDHIKQIQSPVISGWYSESVEPKVEVISPGTLFNFEAHHNEFTRSIVNELKDKDARRKLGILRTKNTSINEFFQSITEGMLQLHNDNHIIDEKTNKRISLGVIRWTNVLPSFMCSQYLLDMKHQDVDILVIPYNGAMLPAMRFHIERVMNSMLKRKHTEGELDPILANGTIRNVLDTRTTKRDVIIVTITTSIEEVGRDHDFDWGIVEPGSVRGLIQMAGRVKRHRPHLKADAPNMLILQKCFKEIRGILGDDKVKTGDNHFIKSFDLRVKNNYQAVRTKFLLSSYDSDTIYDIDSLSEKVDASGAIVEIDQVRSLLQINERMLTNAYLIDDLHEEERLTVSHYINDYMSLVTNHHQQHRKFRRSNGIDVPYSYVAGDRGEYEFFVFDRDVNKMHSAPINNLIEPFSINRDRLLFEHKDIAVLTDDLARRLWGEDDERFIHKKNSLTTVIRQLYSSDQNPGRMEVNLVDHKMLFEQNLGIVQLPKWYDKLLHR